MKLTGTDFRVYGPFSRGVVKLMFKTPSFTSLNPILDVVDTATFCSSIERASGWRY